MFTLKLYREDVTIIRSFELINIENPVGSEKSHFKTFFCSSNGDDTTWHMYNGEVAYIVNSAGHTIERIKAPPEDPSVTAVDE